MQFLICRSPTSSFYFSLSLVETPLDFLSIMNARPVHHSAVHLNTKRDLYDVKGGKQINFCVDVEGK
jgi:hypothetical protein